MAFAKNFAVVLSHKRSTISTLLETAAMTFLGVLLVHYLVPHKPIIPDNSFPWIVFFPLLCTLMYGVYNGVASLLVVLVIEFYVQSQLSLFESSNLLRGAVVGVSAVTLIVGVFSSYWAARVRHIEHLNAYVREHLDQLSRDYFILKISHERLEHAYITKPISLRDAFYQIKEEIIKNNGEVSEKVGSKFLMLLSQYASMSSVALFLVNKDSDDLELYAALGKPFKVEKQDPLIDQVLKKNMTTYLSVNQVSHEANSQYLAAIPLLGAKNKKLGLIVIKDMPFWSVTHDNLEAFSVFASYFAWQLFAVKQSKALLKEFPGCPSEFLQELQILLQLKLEHNVDSALVAFAIPAGSLQRNVLFSIDQHKRTLDYQYFIEKEAAIIVVTLLPLTSLEGVDGYQKRLKNWLKSDFGIELNTQNFDFRSTMLSEKTPALQLRAFLEQLAAHA